MAKQRKSVPGNMSLGVLRRLSHSPVATKSRAHPQIMFHSRHRCFSPVTSLRSLAAVLRTLRMRVNRLSSCSLARYSRSSWCVLCPGGVAGRLVTGSLIIRPPLVLHGVRHRSSVRVGVWPHFSWGQSDRQGFSAPLPSPSLPLPWGWLWNADGDSYTHIAVFYTEGQARIQCRLFLCCGFRAVWLIIISALPAAGNRTRAVAVSTLLAWIPTRGGHFDAMVGNQCTDTSSFQKSVFNCRSLTAVIGSKSRDVRIGHRLFNRVGSSFLTSQNTWFTWTCSSGDKVRTN